MDTDRLEHCIRSSNKKSSMFSKTAGLLVPGFGTAAVLAITALDFGRWPDSYKTNYYVVGLTSLFGFFLRTIDFIDGIGTFGLYWRGFIRLRFSNESHRTLESGYSILGIIVLVS